VRLCVWENEEIEQNENFRSVNFIERDRSPQSDLWIVSDRIKSVIWSKLRVILLWSLRLIRVVAKETHSDLGHQV
jgi:hypothetical protein